MSKFGLEAKKMRESNFELLRIISMALIIFAHYVYYADFSYSAQPFTFNAFLVQALELGGPLGSNLFVLIGGYFLVDSRFSLRRLSHMWISVLFYSVFLALAFGLPTGQEFSPRQICFTLFPVLTGRYWFVTTYIALYALSPFLNVLIHRLERRQLLRLVAVLFVMISLIPTVLDGFYPFGRLSVFLLLYFAAAYVRLYPDDIPFFTSRRRCFGFALGLAALMLVYLLVFLLLGQIQPFFTPRARHFHPMHTAPQLLLALSLFLSFRHLRLRPNRLINAVAGCTFGVYLLHDNLWVRSILWTQVLGAPGYADSPLLIVHAASCCFAIFALCALIDWGRRKALGPLAARLVDRLPWVRREARDRASNR